MDASRVRASLCDYLNRSSLERQELRETLSTLATHLPSTVIFGGMLREFAWGNARRFSSDIDLVSCASRGEVYSAIQCYSPRKNRFGGYRFVSGKRLFDIWSLEDTWAFREGLVRSAGLEALFSTTFFGVDAALFHLQTRRYSFAPSHANGISERVLDINLKENPAPKKMAMRTVQFALKCDLGISPRLAEFVIDQLRDASVGAIEQALLKALMRHVERGTGDVFRFRPQVSVFGPITT